MSTLKQIFTDIYHKNEWLSEESKSGKGSELIQTRYLIEAIDKLIRDYGIASVLDIPCGDFNWMQHVKALNSVRYIGCDIVEELIAANRQKFTHDFRVLDIVSDPLPTSDLVIVRDLFVHFSYDHIRRSIENLKQSKSKYLLTTTFTNNRGNEDMVTGYWRTISLHQSPFRWKPIATINENCTEHEYRFMDKSMSLYLISDLWIGN